MSRAYAKYRGLKRYFTGKPCIHGHICERGTVDGRCRECQRIYALANYYKNHEENKARSRKYQRAHTAARGHEYRINNAEGIRRAQQKYRAKNREKFRKRAYEYALKRRLALRVLTELGVEI